MNYHIKTFNELSNQELYQVLKARVDVFVVEQECPYPEIDDYDQDAIHLFLKNDRAIIAYVRILPEHSRYPEVSIGRVLVDRKYRGKGYARKIMEKAINYIIEDWQENNIKIQAQVYLTDFYTSLGFKQTSDVYLEDGIPHIDMNWERY